MERSRDLRIATTSAANGLSRRRQRITSQKDSAEEDMEIELHEMVSLRDRERLQKKDRDRELPKRRKVERHEIQQKNGGESSRENESTDASDEEYRDDEEDARIHFLNRLNQPSMQSSSLSNNRRSLRTFRSSPVLRASVDETIGVPIPRRARSASIKRLQDYSNSSSFKSGDDLNRRKFSSSPAPANQICTGGSSLSSSGAPMRKKKSVDPRARALKSTSNLKPSSEIQDDIEIEVAEALFHLMNQSQSQSLSQSSKNQENFDNSSFNAADEGLTRGGKVENKTFLARYGKPVKVDPETTLNDSTEALKKEERIEKEKFPNDSALRRGDGFLKEEKVLSPKESESRSCVKVDASEVQDPKVTKAEDIAIVVETKREAKLEIDLMVPPPLASSPGKDVLVDMASVPKHMAHNVPKKSKPILEDDPFGAINQIPKLGLEKRYHGISRVRDAGKQEQWDQKEQKNESQTSLSPFPISLGGWPGVLPHPGYMQSVQAVLPTDASARFPTVMQPPKFKFSQLRPKRSATHQYIACSIHQHQQLITKSLWSGPTGVATIRGTQTINPNSLSRAHGLIPGNPAIGDCQGGKNLAAITGGSGKDKDSEVLSALNSTDSKEVMLQQVSLQAPINHFPHNPAFVFPLCHRQTTKSSGQTQSSSASGIIPLRANSAIGPSGNLSLPGEEAVTSFSSPNLPSKEMQNNGCQVPITANMAMPQLKGGTQSPPLPLFNSFFYSSAMFNVSQSQKLSSNKIVDNSFHSLAAANSQTEKLHFPQLHPSSRSNRDIDRKGSVLFADTQQQITGKRVELVQQPFAVSLSLNTPVCPVINIASMAQNSVVFPMLPDMAWNGYQMAEPKTSQTSEGKSAVGCTKIDDGLKGILGRSETHDSKSSSINVSPVSTTATSIVDGLARSINFVPSVATGNQQPFPPSSAARTPGALPNLHQQQQQSIQLQKHYMQQMQQTGTGKENASTANVLPGPFLPGSFPIQNLFVSKSVQTDNSSYSLLWQNLPRSTAPEVLSQSAESSFVSHSVSAASLQGPQVVNNQAGLEAGSTSHSFISKNAGGRHITRSNVVNTDSTISAFPYQQREASPNGPCQKSSPACRGNVPSILSTRPGQLSELKY